MSPDSLSNITAIVLAAFLGLHFLFLRSAQQLAHRFLGAFLLATGISVLGAELGGYQLGGEAFPMLLGLIDLVNLPPILLLYYAFAVTGSLRQNHQRYRWLWVLVGLELLLMVLGELLGAVAGNAGWVDALLELVQLLSLPLGIVILLLMLRTIREHNARLLNQFSDLENKQLRWLRWLALVNLGFVLIWLVDDVLAALIGMNDVSGFIAELSTYATLANVVWMGFAGLRQPVIYEATPVEESAEAEAATPAKPTEPELPASTEGPSQADREWFEQLRAQIMEQQLYTDPEATVRSLAAMLNVRPRELSRLINQVDNNNFYHFINALRIQHFKALQADSANRHLSIVGLAREAGFKSKSTFYAAFKKLEGTTPLASGSKHE